MISTSLLTELINNNYTPTYRTQRIRRNSQPWLLDHDLIALDRYPIAYSEYFTATPLIQFGSGESADLLDYFPIGGLLQVGDVVLPQLIRNVSPEGASRYTLSYRIFNESAVPAELRGVVFSFWDGAAPATDRTLDLNLELVDRVTPLGTVTLSTGGYDYWGVVRVKLLTSPKRITLTLAFGITHLETADSETAAAIANLLSLPNNAEQPSIP